MFSRDLFGADMLPINFIISQKSYSYTRKIQPESNKARHWEIRQMHIKATGNKHEEQVDAQPW